MALGQLRSVPMSTPGLREIDQATRDQYYEQGWWRTDRTFVDDFLARVAEDPDRPALVSYPEGGGPPERHSYGELEALSRRFAGAFINLGIEPGDVVSMQLTNSWEFPALAIALLRVGAVVNPLVPIFRHRELSFILGRTESKALFVPREFRRFDHGELAVRLAGEIDSLEHVFVLGDPPTGARSFTEFADRAWEDEPGLAEELKRRTPSPSDLAEIQFTSGTTGEPKGVLHDYNTIWSGGRSITDGLGLGPDDVCFMASTLAHQTGFLYGFIVPLSTGQKVVYQEVWDAQQLVSIVDDEQIAYTLSATPFVADMITAQLDQQKPLASFKYFICGGAAIPPKFVEESDEVLGAELVAVWGMTENAVVTHTRAGDAVEIVSDSDGQPVDWMQVRVVDDQLNELPVGEVGNLQITGPNQALGYFHRADLYEEVSTPDGWFDTGDLARRREDGGIRISGRSKDLVIRGGENVPVFEIESLLIRHPKVFEVAVVGYPDERLGERCAAVVAPQGDEAPTLPELVAMLDAEGVAKQFWPERLEIVAEMPKTPSGKIQKFHLRDQLG